MNPKIAIFTIVGLGAVVAALGIAFQHLPCGRSTTAAELMVQTTLPTALELFRHDCNRYPTKEEGIGALLVSPTTLEERWKGPYLNASQVPKDPWMNQFQYEAPGKRSGRAYDLWSTGQDGIESGDDVVGWR